MRLASAVSAFRFSRSSSSSTFFKRSTNVSKSCNRTFQKLCALVDFDALKFRFTNQTNRFRPEKRLGGWICCLRLALKMLIWKDKKEDGTLWVRPTMKILIAEQASSKSSILYKEGSLKTRGHLNSLSLRLGLRLSFSLGNSRICDDDVDGSLPESLLLASFYQTLSTDSPSLNDETGQHTLQISPHTFNFNIFSLRITIHALNCLDIRFDGATSLDLAPSDKSTKSAPQQNKVYKLTANASQYVSTRQSFLQSQYTRESSTESWPNPPWR